MYADNGDTRLPDIPSPETAQILRDTLTACRKLVVLVTTNSKDSKWIPWELGLGDGYHAPDAVALLPAIPEGGPQLWAEREYLGLYDRIVWGKIKGDLKEHWIVWNHQSNTAIALEQWITR